MRTDPARFLPLKPAEFLLLLALCEEELHGYALAREISGRSDGLIHLEPGNLYRVIKRLVDDGLVAVASRRSIAEPGTERRQYYRITALGQRVTATEAARLRAVLATPAVRRLEASLT